MGQEMIELLLVSILVFALAGLLASSISGEIMAVRAKTDDFEEISRSEPIVRALETAFNSGADADAGLGEEPAGWRVEYGLLRIWHEGRVVEIRGVFSDDRSEPI